MVWAPLLNASEREKQAVAVVRALLYEYFLSFHLDLLKFSLLPRLPFFCAEFPEDVQTWQAWSYYSAVFLGAAGGAV